MKELLGIILVSVLIIWGLFSVGVQLDTIACAHRWEESGFESRYLGVLTGCQIKVGGSWIP